MSASVSTPDTPAIAAASDSTPNQKKDESENAPKPKTQDLSVCTSDKIKRLIMDAAATFHVPDTGTFVITRTTKNLIMQQNHLSLISPTGVITKLGTVDMASEVLDLTPFNNSTSSLRLRFKGVAEQIVFVKNKDTGWTNPIKSYMQGTILLDSALKELPVDADPPSQLSKVRMFGNFDFKIVCRDEEEIEVHSLILASQWSFFSNMMDSNMSEVSSKKLTLDYPVDWIEAIVSHFYEEKKTLDFDTATGVVIVAQMYDIPELLTQAMRRIKQEDMDVHQAINTWQKVKLHNKAVSDYCAGQVKQKMANLHSSTDAQTALNELSQLELIELLNNLSLTAKAQNKGKPQAKGKQTNNNNNNNNNNTAAKK